MLVQFAKEGVIAHARPQLLGIAKQPFGQVEAGHWRIGVNAAHMVGVAAENGRLHVAGADHVVGHQQELLALGPGVAPGHDAGQFLDRAGARITGQQEVQHRHEMALARTETAMQVGCLALPRRQCRLDEGQGIVESLRQLRRDHVVAECFVSSADAIGQFEDKVPLMDPLGDRYQFAY
ncbi:MAG TPA: hypothetical protein PK440_13220 [Candidatus Accumulibacter phosphatis]|nr:hypothetical protein [Candidatus Accumulibacter phosphatis]HRQ95941.1 hypothetical protein [Candidatus Accumulibacter phosphatis]